jgi:hypothetical protein
MQVKEGETPRDLLFRTVENAYIQLGLSAIAYELNSTDSPERRAVAMTMADRLLDRVTEIGFIDVRDIPAFKESFQVTKRRCDG